MRCRTRGVLANLELRHVVGKPLRRTTNVMIMLSTAPVSSEVATDVGLQIAHSSFRRFWICLRSFPDYPQLVTQYGNMRPELRVRTLHRNIICFARRSVVRLQTTPLIQFAPVYILQ